MPFGALAESGLKDLVDVLDLMVADVPCTDNELLQIGALVLGAMAMARTVDGQTPALVSKRAPHPPNCVKMTP